MIIHRLNPKFEFRFRTQEGCDDTIQVNVESTPNPMTCLVIYTLSGFGVLCQTEHPNRVRLVQVFLLPNYVTRRLPHSVETKDLLEVKILLQTTIGLLTENSGDQISGLKSSVPTRALYVESAPHFMEHPLVGFLRRISGVEKKKDFVTETKVI